MLQIKIFKINAFINALKFYASNNHRGEKCIMVLKYSLNILSVSGLL